MKEPEANCLNCNSMNPYDVLSAVLFFYPKEDFENDREKIHTAFYEIRKKHLILMKNIVFRNNLLFPRSRVLDEIFSSLQPEFLGKLNPTYNRYQIKKDRISKKWDLKLKSMFESKEKELKEIATELSNILDHAQPNIS